MKYINKYFLACIMASTMGLTSCEKDFLDVNVNPNNPATSTEALTLPAGLGTTAFVMANQFQILGNFWAQHWTQAGGAQQFRSIDQYQITSSDYDARVWGEFYAGALADFDYVAKKANAENNPNYAAIAEIMKAYVFQVLTDAYGDIPFSEALQETANLNPAYDRQEDIYSESGLIAMIDGALAKINNGATRPGNDDLIFGGNMDSWRRFGNTLKLKIYLRQVYAREGVTNQGISRMNNVDFLRGNENADFRFVDRTANRNPIFQTEMQGRGGVNLTASNTFLNYLKSLNDPRIDDFFDPAATGPNANTYVGLNQGTTTTGAATASQLSKPSSKIVGPTAPFPFISGAESLFLQAEAAARGYLTSKGPAEQLYNQGIAASFAYLGESSDPATYAAQQDVAFPTSGALEEKVEAIITQKWIALGGRQGFEAWTEFRRTGYPSFITPSASTSLPAGTFPLRVLYPNSEQVRNANALPIVPLNVPVWWDKN